LIVFTVNEHENICIAGTKSPGWLYATGTDSCEESDNALPKVVGFLRVLWFRSSHAQGIKVGWMVKVINTNNEVKIQFPNSVAAESLLVFRDYSLYM
jgi:TATA-box binding protein (TBP) (component of TFIID and TFIIIB)